MAPTELTSAKSTFSTSNGAIKSLFDAKVSGVKVGSIDAPRGWNGARAAARRPRASGEPKATRGRRRGARGARFLAYCCSQRLAADAHRAAHRAWRWRWQRAGAAALRARRRLGGGCGPRQRLAPHRGHRHGALSGQAPAPAITAAAAALAQPQGAPYSRRCACGQQTARAAHSSQHTAMARRSSSPTRTPATAYRSTWTAATGSWPMTSPPRRGAVLRQRRAMGRSALRAALPQCSAAAAA